MFFPRYHPPGREAAYDVTNCDELGVTIAGAVKPTRIFPRKARTCDRATNQASEPTYQPFPSVCLSVI